MTWLLWRHPELPWDTLLMAHLETLVCCRAHRTSHACFVFTFLKNNARSCKCVQIFGSIYELTDAAWKHPHAVSSQWAINHCPWMYGNGLQTLSTPICSNYDPSERWIQGEYDFRHFLVDGVMSEVLPCHDFMRSLEPLQFSTTGSFF